MILLLSQDRWDVSTEEVQDWIEALGGTCVRLNGEDLNDGGSITFSYEKGGASLSLNLDGSRITLDDVGVVWTRRWHNLQNLAFLDEIESPTLAREIRGHLAAEIRALTGGLDGVLEGLASLAVPRQRQVNKLEALRLAARAGLRIPDTIVTNDRAELQGFKARHDRIITKCIGDGTTFVLRDQRYPMFTEEVSQDDIDRAPECFFPSLFQEHISKQVEIRTFFLAGACYSMAIFSQSDRTTSLDFRHYNQERPNRMVPYRLPEAVEKRITHLMKALSLDTGSLDLIRDVAGEHTFLEVNPVGQFKMVSEPCNYHLEKAIAAHLVGLDG